MIRKGYYTTKGGYHTRIDSDMTRPVETGVVRGFGFVAFTCEGEFAYKDEHPELGDSLDLLLQTWREVAS